MDSFNENKQQQWNISGWDKPDLCYVVEYLKKEVKKLDYYYPNICFVSTQGKYKPVLFIKVGNDYDIWCNSVELRAFLWDVIAINDYAVLRLSVFCEDPKGSLIGAGAPKQITLLAENSDKLYPKLICRSYYDPKSNETNVLLNAWVFFPGPTLIILVQYDLDDINYLTYNLPPDIKKPAITALNKAKIKLGKISNKGNYIEACKSIKEPLLSRWVHL